MKKNINKPEKMTKEEVVGVLEYNMAMLTFDPFTRDVERQDVDPSFYGDDAEKLYYACEYCLNMLNNSIPIKWIRDFAKKQNRGNYKDFIDFMINFWERTNE